MPAGNAAMVVQAFPWEQSRQPDTDACGHVQHVLPEHPSESSSPVEKEDFLQWHLSPLGGYKGSATRCTLSPQQGWAHGLLLAITPAPLVTSTHSCSGGCLSCLSHRRLIEPWLCVEAPPASFSLAKLGGCPSSLGWFLLAHLFRIVAKVKTHVGLSVFYCKLQATAVTFPKPERD